MPCEIKTLTPWPLEERAVLLQVNPKKMQHVEMGGGAAGQKTKTQKRCPICETPIKSWYKFCSVVCRGKSKTLNARPLPSCVDCGETLTQHYCKRCRPCYYKHNRGATAHGWKGGRTRPRQFVLNDPRYKAWRASVFARDHFTCRHCDKTGGRLQAHHIKHFSTHPQLRFEVSNGKTLCVECHEAEHRRKPSQLYFISAFKSRTSGHLVLRPRIYARRT